MNGFGIQITFGISCSLSAFMAMEEIAEAVEVALHDESDALRVERRAGEVAVANHGDIVRDIMLELNAGPRQLS